MNTLRQKHTRTNHFDKLKLLQEELYQGKIPDYILDITKNHVKIRVSDWRGEQDLKVTIKDVVAYYVYWADNITSGCRTLAGYTGDWRPIHRLAKECLEWFKVLDIETLRREARKYDLALRRGRYGRVTWLLLQGGHNGS